MCDGGNFIDTADVYSAWAEGHRDYAPIASARTTEQLQAILAAVDLTLSDSEVAQLNAASSDFA